MGGRAARQLFLVGLALTLWSTLGRPGWIELLGCYLAALALWSAASLVRIVPTTPELPTRVLAALAVVLALPGIRFAYGAREQILERAGLTGVTDRLRDRVRLQLTPAIAPALLSTARPQTFFVYAPGASSARLALAPALPPLQAETLGHGLFRVEYDPRRDGTPAVRDGELAIDLITDDSHHKRGLRVVSPLAHPRWFCRSPSGRRAASVSEESDELIVVDRAMMRVAVGDGPIACAFLDDNTLAVSHRYAHELRLVDLSVTPASVQVLPLPGPLGPLCFDGAEQQLLVARAGLDPAILQVSWPDLELTGTTPLPAAADWLDMSADAALLVATRADASLHALQRHADHFIEVGHLALGRPASVMAVDRARGRVALALTDFHPDVEPQLGNHFVQDQLLLVDVHDLSVQQRVLTARRSARQTKPGDVDQGGSPLGLWWLADGRLAVAFAGTDELWRLQLPNAEPEVVPLEGDSLYAPHGVVELADGRLWLTAPAAGSMAELSPRGAVRIMTLAPSDRELLVSRPDALARRLGERGFYETTRSGIACQSCHLHADSDLAAYNLGDHRLVPTLGVRGLLGTAPYLRDGSYPRIADLDEVAQQLYRGYARPQPGRRYTLQAYVEGLPRAPNIAPRDIAAERRGFEVFLRAGCARCHAPPAFTSLGQLPLAALFPRVAATLPAPETLDVPSLLSVASSPPYLHDGRAATLEAVLQDENPDNLHGKTADMPAAQRGDLLRFLRSL